MIDFYTSTYRYSGADRLDITVKGQDPVGRVFAPTWDMVMGVKNGTLSNEGYTSAYMKILDKTTIEAFISLERRGTVTLVCFCKSDAFCHRFLLANYLVKRGFGRFLGER